MRSTRASNKRCFPRNSCPYESAQARVAIGAFPIECVLYLDASHIANDEADRRMGRSPVGRKANSRVWECAGGQLCSFLGAFSIDGFDMTACEVVDGTIDTDRYMQWLREKVSKVVNPFDGRRLRNSVIVMVRLLVCPSVRPYVCLSVCLYVIHGSHPHPRGL
eukprot:COSAG01_NODE_2470_length_7633_cov_17.854468_8_plen_163_part_00